MEKFYDDKLFRVGFLSMGFILSFILQVAALLLGVGSIHRAYTWSKTLVSRDQKAKATPPSIWAQSSFCHLYWQKNLQSICIKQLIPFFISLIQSIKTFWAIVLQKFGHPQNRWLQFYLINGMTSRIQVSCYSSLEYYGCSIYLSASWQHCFAVL